MPDKYEKMEIIKNILNEHQHATDLTELEAPTFLSVIQRDRYEIYLSRLIAYSLSKDKVMLENLIKKYAQEKMKIEDRLITGLRINAKVKQVSCEQYMNGKRADIFLIGETESGKKFTVTIENKTDTEEHTDQTTNYYVWVTAKYPSPGYFNTFFYLCPDNHISEASCDKYVNLLYSDIGKFIDNVENDYIIDDLKRHIQKKLGVSTVELSNYVREVIKNYDVFQEIVSECKQNIFLYQQQALNEIKEKLEESGFKLKDWKNYKADCQENTKNLLLIDESPSRGIITSYRLYKPEWWDEPDGIYYYYVEILFKYNNLYGDLRGICYQCTLRTRDKDFAGNLTQTFQQIFPDIFCENEYIVLKQMKYDFSGEVWDNPDKEWKEVFVNQATEILPKLIDEEEKIFNETKSQFVEGENYQ